MMKYKMHNLSMQSSHSTCPIKAISSQQRATTGKSCMYCGRKHERNNCPAFGKQYHNCGKLNHFKSVCKQQGRSDKQPISQMEEKSENSDSSIFVVECIGTVTHNKLGQYFVPLTSKEEVWLLIFS